MTEKKKVYRSLLAKRPFFRISPERGYTEGRRLVDLGEVSLSRDKVIRNEVTQADFIRELDTESHAINDREIYKTYYQKDEDGMYYESDFPRYAFPFQQEILSDRLARLTGNDMQFELADVDKSEEKWDVYNQYKAGWADKGMERAWYFLVKSVLSTGDGAFVGIMNEGKFFWKVFSYTNGDILYPHYDRITGELAVFAREYTDTDDEGNLRTYVDVWDKKMYYRLVDNSIENTEDQTEPFRIGIYECEGFVVEDKKAHGFKEIPVAYKREENGPCWSMVQEIIEHYEVGMSRLAQANQAFGMPAMVLTGDGKEMEEIATSDMTYASKIFLVPSDGKLEFLRGEDASNAFKTELDELKKKIYEGAMVVKAPELKSGDTPAAAVKLLYSDSYNKALLETQEYDEAVVKINDIFKWGYGIENSHRLDFANTRIVYYIKPYIPLSENELITNLSMAVQNKYLSRQTASEKVPYSTPNEWERIQKEQHEDDMHTLLIEEQRLEMQNEENIEFQEELTDIQTDAQIEVTKAENQASSSSEDDDDKARKVRGKKGKVSTGRRRGRPRTVNTDKWGNRQDGSENNWGSYNRTH